MGETDPPPSSIEDLKQARTTAKRVVTLQISFLRKLLAEDKADQRERQIASRATLIEQFEEFEKAHYRYYQKLQESTDSEELDKCEDYIAAEQDNYSKFLEFVRDRLGVDDFRDVSVTRHVTEVVSTEVATDADGIPVPNQFTSLLESMNKPFSALVDSMNRPKVTLDKFNGSPAVYHEFIKGYDNFPFVF